VYEFHGWLSLAESTRESDTGDLYAALEELQALLDGFRWPTSTVELRWLNGEPFLILQGLVNRRRYEAEDVQRVLAFVTSRLSGSYGLLFERSDELDVEAGLDGFLVTVVARGAVERRLDPFLSPARVIED